MKNKWNAIKEKICLFFWIVKEKWFVNCLHCITIIVWIFLLTIFKPIIIDFITSLFEPIYLTNEKIFFGFITALLFTFIAMYIFLFIYNIYNMSLEEEIDWIFLLYANLINLLLYIIYFFIT